MLRVYSKTYIQTTLRVAFYSGPQARLAAPFSGPFIPQTKWRSIVSVVAHHRSSRESNYSERALPTSYCLLPDRSPSPATEPTNWVKGTWRQVLHCQAADHGLQHSTARARQTGALSIWRRGILFYSLLYTLPIHSPHCRATSASISTTIPLRAVMMVWPLSTLLL